MKKTTNILLVFAVIIPLVLLFWPFAEWNDAMSVILRIIPSVAVQVLLCRICKSYIVKAVPALLTGAFAAWGTYFFSHHRIGAMQLLGIWSRTMFPPLLRAWLL